MQLQIEAHAQGLLSAGGVEAVSNNHVHNQNPNLPDKQYFSKMCVVSELEPQLGHTVASCFEMRKALPTLLQPDAATCGHSQPNLNKKSVSRGGS